MKSEVLDKTVEESGQPLFIEVELELLLNFVTVPPATTQVDAQDDLLKDLMKLSAAEPDTFPDFCFTVEDEKIHAHKAILAGTALLGSCYHPNERCSKITCVQSDGVRRNDRGYHCTSKNRRYQQRNIQALARVYLHWTTCKTGF